jgi:hypothetical protein
MEYLVEFNSFFKKFKQAVADQNVEVNPDDVVYDIESSISFIKDMGGFDIKVNNDKGSTYKGKNGAIITLPFDKNFFYLKISSNVDGGDGMLNMFEDEFVGFNLELIKEDLIGCIDYIRSKYNISDLRIGITLPKKKVTKYNIFTSEPTNRWDVEKSESKYINIDDLENVKDFNIYSISIFFVI